VGVFSPAVVQHGYMAFVSKQHKALGLPPEVAPIAVHFGWSGRSKESRLHRMREAMWWVAAASAGGGCSGVLAGGVVGRRQPADAPGAGKRPLPQQTHLYPARTCPQSPRNHKTNCSHETSKNRQKPPITTKNRPKTGTPTAPLTTPTPCCCPLTSLPPTPRATSATGTRARRCFG
jgi:hypothetical protein